MKSETFEDASELCQVQIKNEDVEESGNYYNCHVCMDVFDKKLDLESHQSLDHKFLCAICPLKFAIHRQRQEHAKTHQSKPSNYDFLNSVSPHFAQKYGQSLYPGLKNASAKNSSKLIQADKSTNCHVLRAKSDHMCDFCTKEFLSKAALKKHCNNTGHNMRYTATTTSTIRHKNKVSQKERQQVERY